MDMMRASQRIRAQRRKDRESAAAWSALPLAWAEVLGAVVGVELGEWCVVVATA
jgi:hypothetical protein